MELKRCSVCGKERYDELLNQDKPLWKTDITISYNHSLRGTIKKITLCPQCRNLPFNKVLIATRFGRVDRYNIKEK